MRITRCRARSVPARRAAHAGGPALGYVTAETALALPVLVLALVVGLWGLRVVAAQLRCVDAAREAARGAARGDPEPAVREAAGAVAPPGAAVTVRAADGLVTVRVGARVPGPVGIGAVTVSAVATTDVESASARPAAQPEEPS